MKIITRVLDRRSLQVLNVAVGRRRARSRSLTCVQCLFRAQYRWYTSPRPGSSATETEDAKQAVKGKMSGVSNNAVQDPVQLAEDGEASNTNLPSQAERRRSRLSKRFSSVMDHVQSNIFLASQRLNDLTGYSGIEALKRSIEAQEALVQETRSAVRAAKEAYSNAIKQRSASQREVNELLQRKHAWTPQDLERFTALYRSDHANEQAEMRAGETLAAAERAAEDATAQLGRSILARYHEEQIWSDKIRRMSTWGTWGLMGVNVLLFVVFQVGVEPWRRKRLVSGFEDKVRDAILEARGDNSTTTTTGSATTTTISPSTSTTTTMMMILPPEEEEQQPAEQQLHQQEEQHHKEETTQVNHDPQPSSSSSPLLIKLLLLLTPPTSDDPITLPKRHLITLALESAAAGATLCAGAFVLGFWIVGGGGGAVGGRGGIR